MIDLPARLKAASRAHPDAADAVLVLVLTAAALVSVKSVYDEISAMNRLFRSPAPFPVVVSMLGLTIPLLWRRRHPLVVATAVVVAFLLARGAVEIPEDSVSILVVCVAVYSAAVHGRRPARTIVLLVCEVAVIAQVARELFVTGDMAGMHPMKQGFELAFNAVILTAPWALGTVVRRSRWREGKLVEQADELRREREQNALEAVFAERVRIARELHDVVAHHVSVMGIQAGAARLVMAQQPQMAAEALSSIEHSSRTAVIEMHRLLGFLRRDGEHEGGGPQPRLAQLADLVAEADCGELTVTLMIEGDPRTLSTSLEVSAYRIIQEALTNTRKHATGAAATVRVLYGRTTLEIEIVDDGRSAPAVTAAGGHGLIGMRERVLLHGGELHAGPQSDHGYKVRATFPLAGASS